MKTLRKYLALLNAGSRNLPATPGYQARGERVGAMHIINALFTPQEEVTGEGAAPDREGARQTQTQTLDDPLNPLVIIRQALEASGYQVTRVEDGLKDWQEAMGGHYNAIPI